MGRLPRRGRLQRLFTAGSRLGSCKPACHRRVVDGRTSLPRLAQRAGWRLALSSLERGGVGIRRARGLWRAVCFRTRHHHARGHLPCSPYRCSGQPRGQCLRAGRYAWQRRRMGGGLLLAQLRARANRWGGGGMSRQACADPITGPTRLARSRTMSSSPAARALPAMPTSRVAANKAMRGEVMPNLLENEITARRFSGIVMPSFRIMGWCAVASPDLACPATA